MDPQSFVKGKIREKDLAILGGVASNRNFQMSRDSEFERERERQREKGVVEVEVKAKRKSTFPLSLKNSSFKSESKPPSLFSIMDKRPSESWDASVNRGMDFLLGFMEEGEWVLQDEDKEEGEKYWTKKTDRKETAHKLKFVQEGNLLSISKLVTSSAFKIALYGERKCEVIFLLDGLTEIWREECKYGSIFDDRENIYLSTRQMVDENTLFVGEWAVEPPGNFSRSSKSFVREQHITVYLLKKKDDHWTDVTVFFLIDFGGNVQSIVPKREMEKTVRKVEKYFEEVAPEVCQQYNPREICCEMFECYLNDLRKKDWDDELSLWRLLWCLGLYSGKDEEKKGFQDLERNDILSLLEIVKREERMSEPATAILFPYLQNVDFERLILTKGSSSFIRSFINYSEKGTLWPCYIANSNDFILQKKIGSGATSTVWLAEWHRTREETRGVAVKSIFMGDVMNKYQSEMAISSVMRHHPNIVGCFAVSFQQEEALLFFNFYPLSVSDLVLNENVSYSLGRSISLALDVTEGMRYLHSFDLLHRDLKLDNLLIDPIGRVGVCDFGLSRAYAQNMTMAVGSSYYIAPEVFKARNYSQKVDVYSFSYILWSLLMREIPFKEIHFLQLIDAVCTEHKRPPLDPSWPPQLNHLLCRCWSPDPEDRPSFSTIHSELKEMYVEAKVPNKGTVLFNWEEKRSSNSSSFSAIGRVSPRELGTVVRSPPWPLKECQRLGFGESFCDVQEWPDLTPRFVEIYQSAWEEEKSSLVMHFGFSVEVLDQRHLMKSLKYLGRIDESSLLFQIGWSGVEDKGIVRPPTQKYLGMILRIEGLPNDMSAEKSGKDEISEGDEIPSIFIRVHDETCSICSRKEGFSCCQHPCSVSKEWEFGTSVGRLNIALQVGGEKEEAIPACVCAELTIYGSNYACTSSSFVIEF